MNKNKLLIAMASTFLLAGFFFPIFSYANSQASLRFSDKDWYVGFQRPSGETAITEIIPVGETVDNWTEMLTQETFPVLTVTPKQYVQLFVKNLENKINQKIEYRIFKANQRSVSFEWWIPANSSYAQHEWYKLIKYPNQTITLRYTTKKTSSNQQRIYQKNWKNYIYNWDPNISNIQ